MRLGIKVITPIFIFLVFISSSWAQNPLKIYCIDVDQASSTLIVSPTNKYILIDASWTDYGYSTVYPFLQNLGITHLDYTIATHYHDDHIGGMDEVIYSLSGGTGHNESILGYCYDRGDSSPPSNAVYNGYVTAIGSKRRIVGLGETLNLGGGAYMFCVARNGIVVNGTGSSTSSGENYRSIGLVLKYGQFKFFIGGDLPGYATTGEPDVETKVAPVVRNIDVLVVNHHGGPNSSHVTFLDSLKPEVAIISQGTVPQNTGHPYQSALDRLAARNAYIYQMNDNPSGGIIPTGHGRVLNTTAVVTVNNCEYIVNGDTYPIQGVRRDGAILNILVPQDTVAEGTNILPSVRVKNYGNITETFPIRFRIDAFYNHAQTISGLAPNDTATVNFPIGWTVVRGNYFVRCSTEVPDDSNHTNDRQTKNLTVAFFDAELKEIVIPTVTDTFFTNESITPKVVIRDNSQFSNPALVKVYCQISSSSFYLDSVQTILNPGATDTIVFAKKSLAGLINSVYRCSTWVKRIYDCDLSNNFKSVNFVINIPSTVTWEPLSPLLYEVKGVKDGGCLVSTENRMYAFKGNNTNEFYSFDPSSNSWQRKCSLPYGTYLNLPLKRKVKKGGALTYGEDSIGNKVIYALKGNNTRQFWQYDINSDNWVQLSDIPGLQIKAGSGIAFVSLSPDSKYVYCLKGSNVNYEFWAYDVIPKQWIPRQQANPGPNLKQFKDGSCIVAVGESIFALKGSAKYNEVHCYNVNMNSWFERESIPQVDPLTGLGKKKRIKAGGSLTYDPTANKIYAFKGGGVQEFWCYGISTRTWSPKDTLPLGVLGKKGSVKAGASLSCFSGEIYALKGNNTREFWRYIPDGNLKISQITNSQSSTCPLTLQRKVKQNYTSNSATLKLYNISGRLIKTHQLKNYTSKALSDFSVGIQPGIYFIQIIPLENPLAQVKITKKLIITH
jgi:beta-lactamase superfamily II metal-dependent hydrolase